MKFWNGVLKILSDGVLIACGMLAAVSALPSAFGIPFAIRTLVVGCLLGALLLSAWMHLPRGGIVPGAAFLIGTIAYGVVRSKTIEFGASWIMFSIIDLLKQDFPSLPAFPAPTLPEGMDAAYLAASVSTVLLIAAAVIGLLTAYSLIRGKTSILSVMIPLPAFLISLVYTDMPPALWTVVLLMIYCAGALLGQGVRRGNAKRLGLFFSILLPILAAFAALLLAISPQRSFTPIPFEQRKQMLGERAEQIGDALMSAIRRNPKRYDLNDLGDREQNDSTAFSVEASTSGTYLLRAHSYGQYRDGVWLEADEYDGEWDSQRALGLRSGGEYETLRIRNAVTGERYVPYAFVSADALKTSESFIRSAGRTSYEWTLRTATDTTEKSGVEAELAYYEFAIEQYTMPDGEEKDALLRIAESAGIKDRKDACLTAQAVANYVRNSAAYSLTPPKTPDDSDFVQYFLTEGHSGYCVHFASATTAILQAMGIPARYTVGYRAIVSTSDTWIDVAESAAHAWAEVYALGVGWVPIESTAGFYYDIGGTNAPQQPATPEPTAAPTPTPTEAPTAEPTPDATEQANPESPSPSDPTPATQQPGEPTASQDPSSNPQNPHSRGLWWLLLLLPVIGAAWIGVNVLSRARRMNRFRQKNARKAVLCMLRYLKKLERFGVTPEPNAEEWENEALYSNHPMTDTRRHLLARTRRIQDTMYCEKPLRRFVMKWILGII